MEATFPFRQPTSTESSDITSADPAASFECFLMLVDAFLLSIMFEKKTHKRSGLYQLRSIKCLFSSISKTILFLFMCVICHKNDIFGL